MARVRSHIIPMNVILHGGVSPDTVVSCVLKGAGPRDQRAETKTSGAERQKGT